MKIKMTDLHSVKSSRLSGDNIKSTYTPKVNYIGSDSETFDSKRCC